MTDPLPDDWVKTALQVTGHFEDSDDPLGAISGDFDGMGVSVGVLQWNIGSGSLQPLVKQVGLKELQKCMPVFGSSLWEACNTGVAHGLTVVRGWQVGATLRKQERAELKAFARSEVFVAEQVRVAKQVASGAWAAAIAYAGQDPAYTRPTKALFAWFFDVYTQNGGLKGVGYDDVRTFTSANGVTRADDVICDWLATRTNTGDAYKDAALNAAAWRNHVPPAKLSLLVLSYLRALKSRTEYRGDVLNRKATIALGRGWVHREQHDLAALIGA